jgi:hypothetical protein
VIRIFLSYASEDRASVEELYQNLRAAGFQPWMDVNDLEPGEEWQKGIDRGIESSDFFLACISEHSISKTGTQAASNGVVLRGELRTGLETWKKRRGADFRLIPVRLEDVQLPDELKHLQWFNLVHPGAWIKLADHIRKIVRKIKWRIWLRRAAPVAAVLCVLLLAGVGYGLWQRWHKARWRPGPVRVGATLWRLRDVRAYDPPGSKMLVQPGPDQPDKPLELVPERVALGQVFAVGDRVRASFEAAQEGFLYIIDRERLNGDATGPPKLIFPTMKIRNGRNQVAPGYLVETPAQDDQVPYWKLRKQNALYSGELLTIIFAKQPIAELAPGPDLRDVDETWLRTRLKEWEVPVATSPRAAGTPATRAEIEAGKDSSKLLTQRDPLPQTTFSGTANRGTPLVATFPILVSR